MKFNRFAIVASFWFFTAGCGGHTINDLRRRASFDLDCPAAQITVVDLGGGTRGVSGCGHRVTYIQNCRQRAYGACTAGDWVMNTTGGNSPANQTP